MNIVYKEKMPQYLDGWFAQKDNIPQENNPYDELSAPCSYNLWLSDWCDRFNSDSPTVKDKELDFYNFW